MNHISKSCAFTSDSPLSFLACRFYIDPIVEASKATFMKNQENIAEESALFWGCRKKSSLILKTTLTISLDHATFIVCHFMPLGWQFAIFWPWDLTSLAGPWYHGTPPSASLVPLWQPFAWTVQHWLGLPTDLLVVGRPLAASRSAMLRFESIVCESDHKPNST